jgi:hypothetical protein
VRLVGPEGAEIRLVGRMPAGSSLYFDGEWVLGGAPTLLAPIVVKKDGSVGWGGQAVGDVGGDEPDVVAARLLSALAGDASAKARSAAEDGPIEVLGGGFVADSTRALLGAKPDSWKGPSIRPQVIVDTTGDPETIADATRRLANLGSLILAGESRGGALALDLYADVHLRGLRIIGVDRPHLGQPGATPTHDLIAHPPVEAAADRPLPSGGRWYRITAL